MYSYMKTETHNKKLKLNNNYNISHITHIDFLSLFAVSVQSIILQLGLSVAINWAKFSTKFLKLQTYENSLVKINESSKM